MKMAELFLMLTFRYFAAHNKLLSMPHKIGALTLLIGISHKLSSEPATSVVMSKVLSCCAIHLLHFFLLYLSAQKPLTLI